MLEGFILGVIFVLACEFSLLMYFILKYWEGDAEE